jgi:succinate dehydrogenase / fumarate reductase membrane anchor subunit
MNSSSKKTLQSPLAKVRGLGSAKDGTGHWWWQRVTAIALIPLSVWFVYALMSVSLSGDRQVVINWVQSPFVAIALVLLLTALFTHARLGLQVVIEDYVHCGALRIALLLLIKFASLALLAISVLSVLKVHLL